LASNANNQSRTDLTTNFGNAADILSGLRASTQPGADAYADATGANGPEGLARARALFTASPGYAEGLTQTLDQNDRRAASRGMLGSGNTIADTTKLATDYANQKYNDYASRLSPYLGANQGAATGQAGVATGLGSSLNANDQAFGQLGFNAATGVGNAQANADLAAYAPGQNLINLLMGAGKLGASIWGGRSPGNPSSVAATG